MQMFYAYIVVNQLLQTAVCGQMDYEYTICSERFNNNYNALPMHKKNHIGMY